jgi:putative ABC transport system substrate-binding protein
VAALTAGLVLMPLALSACGTKEDESAYTIGISQFMSHPSLDMAVQGFKDVLKEKGVDVKYVESNANGDQTATVTIAGQFAADSDIDLVLAVATPSAEAMVNKVEDRPVLFTAVTDPVESGLVPSWEASGTNVTGTSDLNPNGQPAALIQEVLGKDNAKTVGFLYSLGEANSVVQLEALRAEAEPLGMTVKESGLGNSSELAIGIQALADVDAIFVGTDNAVVSGIEQVVAFGEEHKIPIFVGDAASVDRGAVAARGIDYYEVGRRTGEMAYEILVNGKKAGDIPSLQVTDTEIVVNPVAAEAFGVVIPEEVMKNAAIVNTAEAE